MNKRSEISGFVDSENPDILAITEFGAGLDVSDGELGLSGYSLYRGNHPSGAGGLGKGVALYIRDTLNHSACPTLDNVEFDCATWCTVLLSDGKRLLIGVIYRSPNSPDANNQNMLKILKLAATTNSNYLMVCRDFNLPKINWSTNQCLDAEMSFSAQFLEVKEQLNWSQHKI